LKHGLENPAMTSFMTGVYLALNALDDAFLLVDGPPCSFFRTAQIQGNHDWQSCLVDSDGHHRVADTDCTTERVALGSEDRLVARLREMDSLAACRTILMTAMSMVDVTGRDYRRIIEEQRRKLATPLVWVPPGSIAGDWLDGYAAVLEALAAQIRLDPKATPGPAAVAIVGHLMERNEADALANLAEMRRLLAGLGLELVSCWLEGGCLHQLQQVARAGTVLSFPYGRKAARTLAQRTGARLVECDLPLGLAGTASWLRRLEQQIEAAGQAEELIQRELAVAVPRLQWLLPHGLLGKRVALVGDPYLVWSLAGFCREMGCKPVLRVVWAEAHDGPSGDVAGADAGELLVHPGEEQLRAAIDRHLEQDGIDLLLTNSQALVLLCHQSGAPLPFMELGFASYHTHALLERPWLGMRGVLTLVERMINGMSQAAVYRGAG